MPDLITSRIFVDGEKGITASKLNQIISGAVIQPEFVSSKPASATLDPTDQLLELKSGSSYATVTGQQLIDSVSASVTQNITPTIWSVRLRSYNALGNLSFEVDQATGGGALTIGAGINTVDRWSAIKVGTMAATAQKRAELIPVPGTSFCITQYYLRITLTTAQASLGTGDALRLNQFLEGIQIRELVSDVTSVQVLVRSSVSGLKFGVGLKDSANAYALCKLCTIPSANTWTLLPLSNIPVFTASGSFPVSPGATGASFSITLAAGSSLTASSNDVWLAGNYIGATGQDNFASKAANSTFDIAFVQWEPGNQCSTLIDEPFSDRYDRCLRYYTKSYDLPTALGTVTGINQMYLTQPVASNLAFGPLRFPKPMAKTPTITLYNPATGAAGSIRDGGAVDHGSAVAGGTGPGGFGSVSFSANTSAATYIFFHYVADTGW